MTIFAFIGPTLSVQDARQVLDAEYLPPVAMGDLYHLVETRARPGDQIAIIDGVFEQVPAVWHKEILHALSQGMQVYGASSMGALRAAELHPFGMQGVGRIFEAYRDGIFTDDDEVTVSHATAENGFKALSHSMASLRFGIEELAENGYLQACEASALITILKDKYYPRRSWSEVYQQARMLGVGESGLLEIQRYAKEYDAKRDDALALLSRLASDTADQVSVEADFSLQQTSFWAALCQSQAAKIAAQRVSGDGPSSAMAEISQLARAFASDREQLIERAMLMSLVDEFMHAFVPSAEEIKDAQIRLQQQHQITNADGLKQYLASQSMTREQWREMLVMEAKLAQLRSQLLSKLDPFINLEMRRTGTFAQLQQQAYERAELIRSLGVTKLTLEDAQVTPDTLQNWYESRFGSMGGSPNKYGQRLGFDSLRDFIDELLSMYLYEHHQNSLTTSLAVQ
ncbi:TfuA-like protein [Bowmanella dokdonensis]|uniref:TfuA-like core domain-containing protein n=1 Tax=Bowmanella dokdonensis TaxID=751969 RepID=A0A939IL82_9ALTE|nr:TfuA-like protein [Bowmanella dokdonensis]MBN7823948.1 hypothetical protein [Bowmanella dokdonensis]